MVSIEGKYIEEMIAHARDEAPYEACGVIAGKGGKVVRLYRCANAERSATIYRLEPEEQFEVFTEIEKEGWELYGIYHSHPNSPAYPSPRDIEMAYYPEAVYFLVSLVDKPQVRAFRIVEGEVREEELNIE